MKKYLKPATKIAAGLASGFGSYIMSTGADNKQTKIIAAIFALCGINLICRAQLTFQRKILMKNNIKRIAKFSGGVINIIGGVGMFIYSGYIGEVNYRLANAVVIASGGMIVGGSILIKQSITDK